MRMFIKQKYFAQCSIFNGIQRISIAGVFFFFVCLQLLPLSAQTAPDAGLTDTPDGETEITAPVPPETIQPEEATEPNTDNPDEQPAEPAPEEPAAPENPPPDFSNTDTDSPVPAETAQPAEEQPQTDTQTNETEPQQQTGEQTQQNDETLQAVPPAVEHIVTYNETHFFKGGVSAVSVHSKQNKIFFAGNDGFITSFRYPDMEADTWQVSPLPIKAIAAHPKQPYIAFYETDGMGIHAVSVWNWNTKEPLYRKKLDETVVSLAWSGGGTYLFVGNTSTSGINVFDEQGNDVSVFVTQPGIVLLAATAETERSVVTYSETGTLLYTGLQKKALPTRFESETKLTDPTILKNYTRFAGYKNNAVFVIDALSGKTLQTYKANEPIFATRISDTIPLWLEKTSAASYCIRQGNKASPDFTCHETITAAAHLGGLIFAGTREGNLYALRQENNLKVSVQSIHAPNFIPIIDVQSFKNKLYALTETAVYTASEGSDSFTLLTNFLSVNFKPNKLTACETGIFLWKYDAKAPVYFYSFEKDKIAPFFKSNEPVLAINTYRTNCLITFKFSGIKLFDSNAKLLFSYKISGIRNAVQINEKTILTAKNAAGELQPIYLINTVTNETLPFPINGIFSYELIKNKTKPQELYCFVISVETAVPQTIVYKIVLNTDKPLESRFKKLLQYNGETLDSFIDSSGAFAITNLGGSLVAVDNRNSQVLSLMRSYAFSTAGTFTSKYFYSLNSDGTLGLYDQVLNFIRIVKLP